MSDSGYSSYDEGGDEGSNFKVIGGIVVVLLIGAGSAYHFGVFGRLFGKVSSMSILYKNSI